MGYDRAATARYSFLLAIPAVFGSGLIVIAYFTRYITHRSFLPFVLYRIALGLAIIVFILTGVLSA